MNFLLKDMLLIEDPSIVRLYNEIIGFSNYFIAPVFTIALILEYFSDLNFGEVIKKLLLVVIFMGTFYSFHTQGTHIALESAEHTLRKVSPTNLFVKRWTQHKVKTKKQKGWDAFKSILIPNLNDLLGTAFFLLAKIFIWLLKLIYSSVYHLTYIFAGVTAILYFLGWTKDALKGTIQASLWCMIMPFVIVAILALVGNSIEDSALNGDLVIAKIDTIIWLFGVTLLLLITPLITYGMIRGDGIHSFGSKMGSMVVSTGIKAMAFYPMMAKVMSLTRNKALSPLRQMKTGSLNLSRNETNKNNKLHNINSKKTTPISAKQKADVSPKENFMKSLPTDSTNKHIIDKNNDAKNIKAANHTTKESFHSSSNIDLSISQSKVLKNKKLRSDRPSKSNKKTPTSKSFDQNKNKRALPIKQKSQSKRIDKHGLR